MNANMIRPGGRRAIQVVASFADEAVHVSYLDKPRGGRISPLTAVLVGAGWATFLVGLLVFAMGRAGVGTPMLAGLVLEINAAYLLAYLFGSFEPGSETSVEQSNTELLTTESAGNINRPQIVGKQARQFGQQPIAGQVPVGVVVIFEVIYIQHQ